MFATEIILWIEAALALFFRWERRWRSDGADELQNVIPMDQHSQRQRDVFGFGSPVKDTSTQAYSIAP